MVTAITPNYAQKIQGVSVQPKRRVQVEQGWAPVRYIIDWDTPNRSFIDVHNQLKLLGVKNNTFFLRLLNPRLKGINPYDPNITPEMAMMVVQECQLNIFYYLREVVRIPEQGAKSVPFRLDRATLAAIYCFANDINFYLMKPRQTGKSVGICAMMSWAFKFGATNGGFMFSANKDKNAKDNLKRMKYYIASLPSYLANMGTVTVDNSGKKVRKVNNITSYEEPRTGNKATCANCAISEESAEQIGRGETHVFEFYDEAEFTSYIETIVQVSGMAFNTASQNAIANKAHACRIFATTPGDLSDEKRCQSALKIVEDALTWDERFYDIKVEEFRALVYAKSNYRVTYIEYDYKQLGLGEAWFRNACSNVGNNVSKIRREILLQRFKGNSQSPFKESDIIDINANVKSPVYTKTIGKIYDLRFYIQPEDIRKRRMYFLAIDPSDGTGNDNYAMTVIDPYNLKTVMEFKSEYMSPKGCLELVEYVVRTYFPKILITIESNRNGITLIDFFKESWLKPYIYASPEATQEAMIIKDNYDEKGFLKDELARRKYYGIKTTNTSRPMMMNILVDAVKFRKDMLVTEYLVDDINNLILKGDRIEAAPKKHDDCVMSWCLAMYTYYYGEKLERYGFRRGELPDDISLDDDFIKLQSLYKNPEIRKHFPTMYAFYQASVKDQMEAAHNQKVSQTLQSVVDEGVGSIQDQIIKADPEYGKKMVGTLEHPDAEWRSALTTKWKNLNRRPNDSSQSLLNPFRPPRFR